MASKREHPEGQDGRHTRTTVAEGVAIGADPDGDVESDDGEDLRFQDQFEDEYASEDEQTAPVGASSATAEATAAAGSSNAAATAGASASSAAALEEDEDEDEDEGGEADKPANVRRAPRRCHCGGGRSATE